MVLLLDMNTDWQTPISRSIRQILSLATSTETLEFHELLLTRLPGSLGGRGNGGGAKRFILLHSPHCQKSQVIWLRDLVNTLRRDLWYKWANNSTLAPISVTEFSILFQRNRPVWWHWNAKTLSVSWTLYWLAIQLLLSIVLLLGFIRVPQALDNEI